jgi:hypothetical protein
LFSKQFTPTPLIADYKGDPIAAEDSLWVVQQAQAFVEQIDKRFMGR